MQTTYYKTSNYIRHEGNVVDLSVYRNRLDAVSGGHWVPAAEPEEAWEAPAAELYVVERPRPAAKRRKKSRGIDLRFWLDVCVSGAVLLLTMTAVMQFLRFF
ncbi:MAG: hypothetical protein EOM52_08530 [Clostridia bacterium]|nr:hypothetical protein [Clostridia bacterium]